MGRCKIVEIQQTLYQTSHVSPRYQINNHLRAYSTLVNSALNYYYMHRCAYY